MIHLFHKWSSWSDPKMEGCLSIQRRICQKCNLSIHKIIETFHDYKVEKVLETNLRSSRGSKYLERFTLFICNRCSHEKSSNERHTIADLS